MWRLIFVVPALAIVSVFCNAISVARNQAAQANAAEAVAFSCGFMAGQLDIMKTQQYAVALPKVETFCIPYAAEARKHGFDQEIDFQ